MTRIHESSTEYATRRSPTPESPLSSFWYLPEGVRTCDIDMTVRCIYCHAPVLMVEAFTSRDKYGGRSITYTLGDGIRLGVYTLAMKYVNSITPIIDKSMYIWLFNPSGTQMYEGYASGRWVVSLA